MHMSRASFYKLGLIGQQIAQIHPKLWQPAPKKAPMSHLLVALLLCSRLLPLNGVDLCDQWRIVEMMGACYIIPWVRGVASCMPEEHSQSNEDVHLTRNGLFLPTTSTNCQACEWATSEANPPTSVKPLDDHNLLRDLSQITELSHSWILDPV